MPRPPRLHLEGALSYVTVRGGTGQTLFADQQDLDTYFALLASYKAKLGVTLYAYALQPAQVQLCLEGGEEVSLSRFMHALNAQYSKYHAGRYGRSGHLYAGRYRAVVVEKAQNLLSLIRYLHAQERPLATSLPAYLACLAGEPVSFLDAEKALAGVGADLRHESLILAAELEEQQRWHVALQRHCVGSPEFLARVAQMTRSPDTAGDKPAAAVQPLAKSDEVPDAPRRRWRPGRFLAVAAVVVLATHGAVVWSAARMQSPVGSRTTASVMRGPAPTAPMGQVAMAPAAVAPLSQDRWMVQVTPMGGGHVQYDELSFHGRAVASALLSTQGFAPSNCTMTVSPNGVTWETMQTNGQGDVVCWRGEWDGRGMRGLMTRQAPGGPVQSFQFSGTPRTDEAPALQAQEM